MKRIMIVEDDRLLNQTLSYNLAMEGYEVISSYNCRDARELIKKQLFDLALLDINLPDGSGLDLCAEIKTRGGGTYILFLMANDRESDMLRGYEAGGADYVTKPFSLAVLCKKVAVIFENLEQRNPLQSTYDDGTLKMDFAV